MKSDCGRNKPHLNTISFKRVYIKSKDMAMEHFIKKKKMGGEDFSEFYKIKLEDVRQ